MKTFRTDRGTEDLNKDVTEIMARYGIKHETTVGYAPEQNGSAERDMRTLEEGMNALSSAKGLEKKYWTDAICTMTYVLNQVRTSSVKGKTPGIKENHQYNI